MPSPPSSEIESPPQGKRVLVVDDDRELCALIRDYLEPLGFQISAAFNGPEGLEKARSGEFDAVLLDVMLPGLDGFEVLRRLRTVSEVPVLMLTARGEEADRIVGLEIGADDYLPKTFSTRELLARLRAVLRRAASPGSNAGEVAPSDIVVGDLRINPESRTAVLGDRPLDLTALEFNILECLARGRGRVKSREQLIEALTDRHYEAMDRSVDVHIWALRKKLGDDPKNPRHIRTIRSVGYMLINPDAA